MDWLAYSLARLTARERILLLTLIAVAVPLAVAFLAVAPMLAARDAARTSLAEAEALRDWVADRVVALPPGGLSAPATEVTASVAPIGLSGLEQSLFAADLRDRVAQLSNRSGGGVDLEFDAVEFDTLIGWLSDTVPGWGYDIAAFRIERADPGLAVAGFTLEPAQ